MNIEQLWVITFNQTNSWNLDFILKSSFNNRLAVEQNGDAVSKKKHSFSLFVS